MLTDEQEGGAEISPCGRYRWSLSRRWGGGRLVGFVMLNPSTADARLDDPTIRRCIGFARSWGYGGLNVVNLFALRATDPSALEIDIDPVGQFNDESIIDCACRVALLVCAWGAHKFARHRASHVLALLRRCGAKPHAIAVTKSGAPSHPLYLKADLLPLPFGDQP